MNSTHNRAELLVLDADTALERQDRIRSLVANINDLMDELQALVAEAKASDDYVALGYSSWTAYLADTLGAQPLRLDREERRSLVGMLAGEGMSTRAIAPIVGAGNKTVARDIAAVSVDTPDPAPSAVTGLDGKTYTPRPPRPTVTLDAPDLNSPEIQEAIADLRSNTTPIDTGPARPEWFLKSALRDLDTTTELLLECEPHGQLAAELHEMIEQAEHKLDTLKGMLKT